MIYELLSKENLAYAVGLAKELHDIGVYGQLGPPCDWDHTYRVFDGVLHNPNGYMCMARNDAGVYVGIVGGHVYPFMFSPKLQGMEDGWYVREGTPKRASIAMRLMHGFVDWCIDEKGAVMVQTGDIASISSHAVDTLYRHMGFKRFGTLYMFQRT